MTKKKSYRRKVGDIVKVPLVNEEHSYGHITTEPCIIFYDGKFSHDLPVQEIIQLSELFNLSVYNYAVTDGDWPVIGHSELPSSKRIKPYRFKQDSLTGELFLYHSDFLDTNYERPATIEECLDLECAAVWEPNHVVDRLIDYYEGRDNKWVKQLAIDIDKVPRK